MTAPLFPEAQNRSLSSVPRNTTRAINQTDNIENRIEEILAGESKNVEFKEDLPEKN